MALRLSTATRNTRGNAISTAIDAGAGAGTLAIYSGSIPTSPASPPNGTLLVTFTLADPVAGAAVNGVVTWNAIAATNVATSGTAGWFRVADSNGTAIFDGTVTATGAGGDLQLDSTALVSGRLISIDSVVLTEASS